MFFTTPGQFLIVSFTPSLLATKVRDVKSSQVVTNGGYEQVVSDVSEAREVDVVLQIWTLGMAFSRCWEAGVPGF